MGIWQIHAVSSITGLPIHSIYTDFSAFTANLVSWSNEHGIIHRAVNDLLKMLKAGVPALSSLPLCARTLLKTPRNIVIQQISVMDYYYSGLQYQLRLILASYPQTMVEALNTLELILNIDGLPSGVSGESTDIVDEPRP